MACAVKLAPHAVKQLAALPRHIQKRVSRWIDLLAIDPRRAPSRQLQGYPDLRRVHASKDYVIVYSVLDAEIVVLIIRVAHRGEVYRRL
jgi:mRNA interferase RelE/StbE